MVAQVSPHRPLTAKEEVFIRAVVAGKSYGDAYRLAYNATGKPANYRIAAFDILQRPEVAARLRELQERANESAVLTRTEKRAILANIARKASHLNTRIQAVKVDNEMSGDNAAVKVEGELTLGLVLSSVKQVKPITEVVQEPEPMTLQEAETALPSSPPVTVTGDTALAVTSLPPAIPFDSGPFADQVAVLPPTQSQTPVKLTRTRSYDE